MSIINKMSLKKSIIPIVHVCSQDKVGNIMSVQDLHQFSIDLMIAFFHEQRGKCIGVNMNINSYYPTLIFKNPNNELLYIWVNSSVYPKMPKMQKLENADEIKRICLNFNATPVFAGLRLKCLSNLKPICGGEFTVEYSGLKMIDLG